MKRRPLRGFTLVELLVVITIIGTLMGMLLPAVNYFRESANRMSCSNNEHNLAVGLLQYESTHRGFPGYVNCVGTDSSSWMEASWVVMLLPALDRPDLWEVWRQGKAYTPTSGGGSGSSGSSSPDRDRNKLLKIMICPSNPPERSSTNDTPLAYVINAGFMGGSQSLPKGSITQAYGVAVNAGMNGGQQPYMGEPRVTLDYISQNDGAGMTLLVSENINTDTGQNNGWTYPGYSWGSSDHGQFSLGFVWSDDTSKLVNHINKDFKMRDPNSRGQCHARPSSRHNGGVNAGFCDGRVQFLKEDLDPTVYWHLMTPSDRAAKTSRLSNGIPGILSDGDF